MTETQQQFFARLDKLGTGERAALRRASGRMLREADGAALTAFYRCLPSAVDTKHEDKWFSTACLRCLWDAGEEGGRPIEQVIGALVRSGELSDSTGHRVELLLDTKWDSDGYMLAKLTRLVKLVRQKSERAMLDFSALLDDMIRWNSNTQTVQRKWARAVFSNDINNDKKE